MQQTYDEAVWFWCIYGLLVSDIVVAGADYIASGSVAFWPARDLPPVPIDGLRATVKPVFAEAPELVPSYNDWAVRDHTRSIFRDSQVRYRCVLLGGSFLKGYYIPTALAELVERRWPANSLAGMEAINPTIAATGPGQSYVRIKKVALALDPDAVVVFVGEPSKPRLRTATERS